MEDKKKRTANYSRNEKSILTELVMKYKSVIENKKTDATTNSQKLAGWIHLAQEFNTLSNECHRTANNLKTCWENIKRQTKKDVSNRKKEIFMTGGGKPPPPSSNNDADVIVEAVLGPALEGLPNTYDSDAPDFENTEMILTPIDKNYSNDYPQKPNVNILEDEKENQVELVNIMIPTTTKLINNLEKVPTANTEQWENWTPKTLKRPISKTLCPSTSDENYMKRRRPRNECSADVLLRKKIELIDILKNNAQKESELKILILEEQLKQEQIKTEKLNNNNNND